MVSEVWGIRGNGGVVQRSTGICLILRNWPGLGVAGDPENPGDAEGAGGQGDSGIWGILEIWVSRGFQLVATCNKQCNDELVGIMLASCWHHVGRHVSP